MYKPKRRSFDGRCIYGLRVMLRVLSNQAVMLEGRSIGIKYMEDKYLIRAVEDATLNNMEKSLWSM